jgi:putative sigma-54 modulation protein
VEITVTGRHPKITQQMRTHAEEKVQRMTRMYDRLLHARVTLEIDGAQHRAEASVFGPRGTVLVAHATASDMFVALDEMEDRLEQQLRKLKTRIANDHGGKVALVAPGRSSPETETR